MITIKVPYISECTVTLPVVDLYDDVRWIMDAMKDEPFFMQMSRDGIQLVSEATGDEYHQDNPITTLVKDLDGCIVGLDPTNKESFLAEGEFECYLIDFEELQMTKDCRDHVDSAMSLLGVNTEGVRFGIGNKLYYVKSHKRWINLDGLGYAEVLIKEDD